MGPAPILFENLSEISLKGDLSNATTFNPPLFSLVNTFKGTVAWDGFLAETISYDVVSKNRFDFSKILNINGTRPFQLGWARFA